MSQWDSLLSLLRLLDRPDAVTADGALSPETAEALSAVVPCDTVALFEFHRPTWTTTTYAEWLDSPGLFDGRRIRTRSPRSGNCSGVHRSAPSTASPGTRAMWPCSRTSTRARDGGPRRCTKTSWTGARGGEAIVSLAAPPGMCRRLLLTQAGAQDYDDDDRLMLRLLRPQINAAIGRAAGRQLTPRQLEVLRLAAVGSTYTAIGHSLHIAPDTARSTWRTRMRDWVRGAGPMPSPAFSRTGCRPSWFRQPYGALCTSSPLWGFGGARRRVCAGRMCI
jgi:DNA-binding CsgD family transcriptional regulator